jgi:hypothetical protein
MSEHIQPAPSPHSAPGAHATAEAERTPGVAHESLGFNFRLIVRVGIGLVITAVVIHVVVLWLMRGLERAHEVPGGSISALALEDANRTLDERLQDVPSPHLEGIERESSLLILRVGESDERRFFIAPNVIVRRGEKAIRLFELQKGERVSVTYHLPGGAAGGIAVATSVTTPPQIAAKEKGDTLAHESHIFSASIVRVEPRSVAAAREWAEVQMERYGWAEKQHGIARIPVAAAMEEVLKSKEFRPPDKGKKSDGRPMMPTRSNSGRGRGGEGQ